MTKTNGKSEALIGLGPLAEIIETALFSANVSGSIPISIIIIGPSGAGKSKVMMQYHETAGCHLTNDVTSMGLQELLAQDFKGELKFLVIPDFNLVLSHRGSTLQLTVANLLSVTSEGTVRIDDGREKKETKHSPVGILTAMTRDLYESVARKWAILGFNRRFIPIYYDYKTETKQLIQESIACDGTSLLQLLPKSLIMSPQMQNIDIESGIATRIQATSDDLATNIGFIPVPMRKRTEKDKEKKSDEPQHIKGRKKQNVAFIGKALEFTPHLALRTLARAHALRDGRDTVNGEDLQFIYRLLEFTRFDRPGML